MGRERSEEGVGVRGREGENVREGGESGLGKKGKEGESLTCFSLRIVFLSTDTHFQFSVKSLNRIIRLYCI